ncbi:hypothetical protein E4T42_03138 [Aureobasidium subglaciale]|nr:hypothetical protein E4T42_03138 [Aureobasidium subglaciale]
MLIYCNVQAKPENRKVSRFSALDNITVSRCSIFHQPYPQPRVSAANLSRNFRVNMQFISECAARTAAIQILEQKRVMTKGLQEKTFALLPRHGSQARGQREQFADREILRSEESEDHEVASCRKRTAEFMFSLRTSSAGCLRSSAGGVVERLRPTWDAQVGSLKGAPPARRVPSGHLACTMHTVPGPTQSLEDLET